MTEAQPEIRKPGPSRKAIIGWTLAMFAALALAWFVGTVGVPVWRTRGVVGEYHALTGRGSASSPVVPSMHVARLGEPAEAVRRLGFYVGLPDWLAPHPTTAVALLGHSGRPAVGELVELLGDGDAAVRAKAAEALGWIADAAALEPLKAALADPDSDVRAWACHALAEVGWAGGLYVEIEGPASVARGAKDLDVVVLVTNVGEEELVVLPRALKLEVQGPGARRMWEAFTGGAEIWAAVKTLAPGQSLRARFKGYFAAGGYVLTQPHHAEWWKLAPGRCQVRVRYKVSKPRTSWLPPGRLWTGTVRTARFEIRVESE